MNAISAVESGCPPLFEPFIGTLAPSDSSATCARAVWLSPSPAGLLALSNACRPYPRARTSILNLNSGRVYQTERKLVWESEQADWDEK